MRFLRARAWILVLFAAGSLIGMPTANGQQDSPAIESGEPGSDAGHFGSLFESLIANAQAVQAADVLVAERTVLDATNVRPDGPHGQMCEELTVHRIVFDVEQKRHAVYRRTVATWTNYDRMDEENAGRTVGSLLDCWILDIDTGKMRFRKDGQTFEGHAGHFAAPGQKLYFGEFVDPRTLCGNGIYLDSLSDYVQRLKTGVIPASCSTAQQSTTVRAQTERDKRTGSLAFLEFVFDGNGLAVGKRSWVEFSKGGQSAASTATFVWKPIGGVFVPVSGIWKDGGSRKSPEGSLVIGHLSRTVRQHWFSVNEPVDPALFDPAILGNDQRLQELTDLQRNDVLYLLDPPDTALKKQ